MISTISNDNLKTSNVYVKKNITSVWAIQPLLTLGALVGIKKVKLENKQIVSVGTFEKAYSMIFLVTLISGFLYFGQYRFFLLKDISLNYAITDMFSLLSLIITCCNSVLISIFFSSECIIEFFNNLNDIDEILKIDSDSLQQVRKKVLIALFSHLSLICFETIFNGYAWGWSMYSILWLISFMIIDWMVLELIIYLYFLRERTEKLNEILTLYSSNEIQKTSIHISTNSDLKIKQVIPYNKFEFSKKQIIQLMAVYDKIADNAHILNVTFGSTILFASLLCFVTTITTIITYFRLNKQNSTYLVIISIIEWWIRCISSVYFGVTFSEKLTEKCNQITLTLNKNIFFMKKDFAFHKIIEKFSLLTSTRLVNISACNFFNYDYTFFVSMCGALTSYAVILMQSSNDIRTLGKGEEAA